MKRPIQIFEELKAKYISYIETDFWALDEDFQKARRKLLEDEFLKAITQEPWFEIIRKYKSSGKKVTDLNVGDLGNLLTEVELNFFRDLASAGLVGDFPLYEHQLEMLQKYSEGKNCIITSGTGSGKTESFLLPLMAYLSKYYMNKEDLMLEEFNADSLWYVQHQNSPNARIQVHKHRTQDQENNCVKAMIFYPMNALVADQIGRLRKALSFDKPEEVFRNIGKGRIYFGQYNSRIKPIKFNLDGSLRADSKKSLQEEMFDHHGKFKQLMSEKETRKESEFEELLAMTPCPYRAELLNRYDIQQTPPDILITNYSMLNVMMMRKEENEMFDKTKEWLNESNENLFHLIVDELHLNRGTAGAEVSWLLQLYLHRIGLHPGHPQLRILASSASLDDADDYVEKFFGFEQGTFEDNFAIITDSFEPHEAFEGEEVLTKEKLLSLYERMPSKSRERGEPEAAIKEIFSQELNKFLDSVKSELTNKLEIPYSDKERKTIPLSKVQDDVFPDEDNNNKRKLTESLFYLRSLYDERNDGRDLPRLRMHALFNNLPGLFTEIDSLNALSKDPYKIIQNGKRMVQLMFCYECGTLLFGGFRHTISDSEFEILPIPAGLDDAPDKYASSIPDFMNHQEFVVFWPDALNKKEINEEFDESNRKYEYGTQNLERNEFMQKTVDGKIQKAEWTRAFFNPVTGRVLLNEDRDDGAVRGYLFHTPSLDVNDKINIKALPAKCPCCAQAYHHMSKRNSPIRHFSTPHNKTAQLLSTQLLKEISTDPDDRKLIAFSDSRSAAAKLASQLEQDNYWDSMRRVIARMALEDERANEKVDRVRQHADEGGCWNNLDEVLKEYLLSTSTNVALVEALKYSPENSELFKSIIPVIMQSAGGSNEEKSRTIDLQNQVLPRGNANNQLLETLLKKGIPPMGSAFSVRSQDGVRFVSIREFKVDNRRHKWYEVFENGGQEKFPVQYERIKSELLKEFSRGLFGRNRFTIEMMAKGYVSFKKADLEKMYEQLLLNTDKSKETFRQAANTAVRIIGYKFRTISYPDLTADRTIRQSITAKHPLNKYWKKIFGEDQRPLNVLLELLETQNPHALDPVNFDLVLAKENSDVIICANCQTPHLHYSAGVCAHCMRSLSETPTITAGDFWSKNYYTHDTEEDIIRLHCEELTGQTDNFEDRQRMFKNLFMKGEKKEVEQIDIISATTTMEVGIDIGSLSATLMGNMAPERFNYQQRVGRAGRGGQAFSLALTICRNSSHDAFYYEDLDKMLNDKPPTPFYPDDVDPVKRRFYFKELLRNVFSDLEFIEEEQLDKDTHGRMGKWTIWESQRDMILKRIDSELESSSFINWQERTGVKLIASEIADIIENTLATPVKAKGLASTLAENGLLPMYGMPTNVRVAYLPRGGGEISRDAEIALSEFAPGGELLKDKKYYPMTGITSPRYQVGPRDTRSGEVINDDESNVFYYLEGHDGLIIKAANEEINDLYQKAIMPNAYYSKQEIYQTNPNKQRHQVGLPKFNLQRAIASGDNQNAGGNLVAKLYTGDIYSFNANHNSEGFEFWERNWNNGNVKQWTSENPNGNGNQEIESLGKYVLANKTYTSVLEIKPESNTPGLRYGAYLENEDSSRKALNTALKGAAYSAAFILRSVFTTDLDVDGEELRVLQLRELNDSKQFTILYADQLVNGSGFCERLHNQLGQSFKNLFDPNTVNQFAKVLMSEPALDCDSASYGNILNYRNLRFHSILDWRLGLTYLRMLNGIDADKILKSSSDLHEFKAFRDEPTWLEGFSKLFENWVDTLNMGNYYSRKGVPVCVNGDTVYIGIHPLWDIESPSGLLADIIEEQTAANREIKYVDSFNLLRRPGYCKTMLEGQNAGPGI
jgi:DEAD/DEAH box helicase domain-containing protein